MSAYSASVGSRTGRWIAAVPHVAVTALIVLAIVNLLVGVFMRYVVGAVTDYYDMDPIRFEWVEEVGELSLAWLTLLGAAIGVRQRSHFTLHVLMPMFPARLQRAIDAVLHLLIAAFGLLIAWYGYGLVKLNFTLDSPGLGISLAWLYGSSVVGGILLAVYALSMVVRPSEPAVPGAGHFEGEI